MGTGYFYSLFVALMTSASVVARVVKFDTDTAPMMLQGCTLRSERGGRDDLYRKFAGVAEAKPKAIVACRESNRSIASVGELLETKGVGKAILEMNREKLAVNCTAIALVRCCLSLAMLAFEAETRKMNGLRPLLHPAPITTHLT